jgi:quercetin dioxygenase-like cupin family protein
MGLGCAPVDTWDINSLELEPHRPQVLRTDDEARVVAINLPAGEELQEHQVHERAYAIVASGEVEFGKAGETVSGGPGLIAHFEPNERHDVRAVSDARVILILAPWPGEGHPSRREERST